VVYNRAHLGGLQQTRTGGAGEMRTIFWGHPAAKKAIHLTGAVPSASYSRSGEGLSDTRPAIASDKRGARKLSPGRKYALETLVFTIRK